MYILLFSIIKEYIPSISHRSPVNPNIQLQLLAIHTPLMQDGLHRAGCGYNNYNYQE